MGCAQSRIDNEEAVSRCKDRKLMMKQALTARNAFAAAHFAYAVALKNTGVALSGYAHGEASATAENPEIPGPPPPPESAAVPLPPPPPPQEQMFPPPPPLPSFSPSPASLQRSVTMPELPVSKRGVSRMGSISVPEDDAVLEETVKNREIKENGGVHTPPAPPPHPNMAWDYFYMNQEEDEEEDDDDYDDDDHHHNQLHHGHDLDHDHHDSEKVGVNVNVMEFEFQTPEKLGKMEVVVEEEEEEEEGSEMETPKPKHLIHSNTAPAEIRRISKAVFGNGNGNGNGGGRNSVNWFKVLKDIDDHFLKASDCAQDVSRLLEANRYQYHYNFADTRVPVDHAARMMRVITWNRTDAAGNGKDDYYNEDNETHAIVLDKLMAWEKKLYDEVKASELMKMEYQRKVALLTKQKKRGAGAESLEKTKAAVSHLHTRYIVDMQSMDSTVSEVNELRDHQLYPKLVELVDAMANMWENMSAHHDDQLKIVTDIKSLDIIILSRETTRDHFDQTAEFLSVVEAWQTQFEKLVTNQKSYVGALHSWLKLNLIPIESSLKEKVSSPPRIQDPPIKALIQSWNEFMEKLPDELVITSISQFAAVIRTIVLHQEEEIKLKEKWEETNKEYRRKKQAFEEWFHKHNKRIGRGNHGDTEDEPGAGAGDELATVDRDPVSERRFVVDSLKKRLDEEVEDHRKHCLQVREKSMGSLKTRLPELFRAMSDYSHACADAYSRLRVLALSQNPSNGGPS